VAVDDIAVVRQGAAAYWRVISEPKRVPKARSVEETFSVQLAPSFPARLLPSLFAHLLGDELA
jgi:hypothetical protein